jgi:hypothetical protein
MKFKRIRTYKVMREAESRCVLQYYVLDTHPHADCPRDGEHVFHVAHLSQSSLIETLSEGRLHKRSASPMDVDEPLAEQGPAVDGRESSPMEVDEDWEDEEDRKAKEPEEFPKLLITCLRMLTNLTISSRKRKADGYPFAMPAAKRRRV